MLEKSFTSIANTVARAAGLPLTFAVCVAIVVIWAASGPVFHFSDTWQLVINTSTTIVTFLMVFLIQSSQNRDGIAIQAKLDELIRVSEARNIFVGSEHLTETELAEIRELTEQALKRSEASAVRDARSTEEKGAPKAKAK